MKKSKHNILFTVYLILLFPPLFELAVRIIGYKPYQQISYSIESDPEFCLIPHPHLGFGLNPGTFQVKINQGLRFSVSQNLDSCRITSFAPDSGNKPEILIMGCSYTYGFGVDDSLTYPFLLQKNLPDYHVKNLAVPGYGTIQSLLQLENAIEDGRVPETAIINYADFHDDRNVLSPAYRRSLYLGFLQSNPDLKQLMVEGKVPYVMKKGENYEVVEESWLSVYQPWEGSGTWATVNFFQVISENAAIIGMDKREASAEIFMRIRELCKKNGIRLIVAGLTDQARTHEMLENLAEEGIETLDMSLDLRDNDYNHLPYDSHPNEKAHAYFAKKVYEYLMLTPVDIM